MTRTQLILTKFDNRFTNKIDKKIYLGSWATEDNVILNYDNILKYHWSDLDKKERDFYYLENLQDKILDKLVLILNKYHNVNYDKRFYIILIGPWLRNFVTIYYDRMESLIRIGNLKDNYIVNTCSEQYIPLDIDEFNINKTEDTYNYIIFSELLNNININNINIKNIDFFYKKKEVTKNVVKNNNIKDIANDILYFFAKKYNSIAMFQLLPNIKKSFLAQLFLIQFPIIKINTNFNTESTNIDYNFRNKSISIKSNKLFEITLFKKLLSHIPSSYIENFDLYMNYGLKKYPSKAKIITTSFDPLSNDPFIFWLSYKIFYGAEYIYFQQGGGYNVSKYLSYENHILSVCDKFISYGDYQSNPKSIPFYMTKTLNIKPKEDGDILFTFASYSPYTFSCVPDPISSDSIITFCKFVELLDFFNKSIKKLIVYRLYKELGWNETEYINTKKIKIENIYDNTFEGSINKARLVVSTYNSTTYLQTFNANFPTLLLWNKEYCKVNNNSQYYFDLLHAAKILHYDNKTFSKHLSNIYKNPSLWWFSEEVQYAVNIFLNQYCKKSNNIIWDTIKIINSIKNNNHKNRK